MNEDSAVDAFLLNPHIFEFFQAIRILSRRLELPGFQPGDARAARDSRFDSGMEPARVGAHTSFAFPASDIQSVTEAPDGTLEMRVNMMGLAGVSGPLPHYYTSLILQAKADKDETGRGDTALEDFFNIFNHRLAYLFYYAWEKSRFPAMYDRTGRDPLRQMLLALAGVPSHLPTPGGLDPDFFVRFAPLLAMQPRSGETLRTILAAFFEVEVEIEQYTGTWRQLNRKSLSEIGSEDDSISGKLGQGTVAGGQYWSLDSMARIRLGPLSRTTFNRFLPGAEWNTAMREICRFFSRDEIEFEVQLVLNRLVVPGCRLGGGPCPQLGWTTWLKSKPAAAHQDGVVFRL
jgi:type VI secretion system protein ImpH